MNHNIEALAKLPLTGGVFGVQENHFWSAAIPLPLFHARFSGTVTVDPSLTFRARKEPDVLDFEQEAAEATEKLFSVLS